MKKMPEIFKPGITKKLENNNKVFYSEKLENSIEKTNKNYEYIPF